MLEDLLTLARAGTTVDVLVAYEMNGEWHREAYSQDGVRLGACVYAAAHELMTGDDE